MEENKTIISKRIKSLRKEKGLTQEQLAEMLNLNAKSSIANYESGANSPSDDIKKKMREIFNCSIDYLMGISPYKNYEEFKKLDEEILNYKRTPEETKLICDALNYINTHEDIPIGDIVNDFTKNLPVNKIDFFRSMIIHLHYRFRNNLSQKNNNIDNINIENKQFYMCPVYGQISAGQPNWVDECIEGRIPIDPIMFGIDNPEEHFFLRVSGESMNKVVKNNGFALIRKQDTAENGDIVAVLINEYDATLKKFTKDGGVVVLEPMSENPTFQTQIYDEKTEIKILGKYIGKFEMNK